jgi:hypothetical protein
MITTTMEFRMKKYKNILFVLLSVLILSGLPAMAQTPQDSAAERARSQTNPAADQASPGSTQDNRVMLQDTGGKSGVSGQAKMKDTATNGRQTNPSAVNYNSKNKFVTWGIVILIVLIVVAVVTRYNKNRR